MAYDLRAAYCMDLSVFIMQLLEKRLQDGQSKGELGVLLDGFPRTRRQAQMLALIADTQLAVNLSLRPEVRSSSFLSRIFCLGFMLPYELQYFCCVLSSVSVAVCRY